MEALRTLLPRWRLEALRQYHAKLQAEQQLQAVQQEYEARMDNLRADQAAAVSELQVCCSQSSP